MNELIDIEGSSALDKAFLQIENTSLDSMNEENIQSLVTSLDMSFRKELSNVTSTSIKLMEKLEIQNPSSESELITSSEKNLNEIMNGLISKSLNPEQGLHLYFQTLEKHFIYDQFQRLKTPLLVEVNSSSSSSSSPSFSPPSYPQNFQNFQKSLQKCFEQSFEILEEISLNNFQKNKKFLESPYLPLFFFSPTDLLWNRFLEERKLNLTKYLTTLFRGKTGIKMLESIKTHLIQWITTESDPLKTAILSHSRLSHLVTAVYGEKLQEAIQPCIQLLQNYSSQTQINNVLIPPYLQVFVIETDESVTWNNDDNLSSLPPGDVLLVLDEEIVGVWWHKQVMKARNTIKDLYTYHDDLLHGRNGVTERLEGSCFVRIKPLIARIKIAKQTTQSKDIRKIFPLDTFVLYNDSGSRWIEGKISGFNHDNTVIVNFNFPTLLGYSDKKINPANGRLLPSPIDKDNRKSSGIILLSLFKQLNAFSFDLCQLLENPSDQKLLDLSIWNSLHQQLQCCEHIYCRYLRVKVRNVSLRSQEDWLCLLRGDACLDADQEKVSPLATYFKELTFIIKHQPPRLLDKDMYRRMFLQIFQPEMVFMIKWLREAVKKQDFPSDILVEGMIGLSELLFSWRILNTQFYAIKREEEPLTTDEIWMKQAFENCEDILQGALSLLCCHTKALLTNYSSLYIFSNIYQQEWTSSKPFFSERYCTHGIQMWIFYLRHEFFIMFDTLKNIHIEKEKRRSTELFTSIAISVFVESLEEIASIYMHIKPSRGRINQYRIDILYLLLGSYEIIDMIRNIDVQKIWKSLDEQDHLSYNKITSILSLLASHLALICGDCDDVLEASEKLIQEKEKCKNERIYDWINELRILFKIHSVNIPLKFIPEMEHSILDKESETISFNILLTEGIDWKSVISYYPLETKEILSRLEQRHEVTEWEYPILTPSQEQNKNSIKKFLQKYRKYERN